MNGKAELGWTGMKMSSRDHGRYRDACVIRE